MIQKLVVPSSEENEWVSLPFDSKVLQLSVASLAANLELSRMEAILDGCAAKGIELVYWMPDLAVAGSWDGKDWFSGYLVAQSIEFNLSITSLPASSMSIPPTLDGLIIEAVETGCSALADCAEEIRQLAFLAGEYSRFRQDSALTSAQFRRMYSAWVQNSLAGVTSDQIFMVRSTAAARDSPGDEGAAQPVVAGFVTVKLSKNKSGASIGLLAVSPFYRRQGVGAALVRAAVAWAQSQGVSQVRVKTQAENQKAVAFYASQGFAPIGPPQPVYHIWLTHRVLPRVRYNVPYVTGEEVYNLVRIASTNALDSLGPYTTACERWIERTLGCPKALLTLSATAAIEQAALLCNLTPGDEVIMPSFTFVSTANAVALRGATPVFVDVGDDLNVDVDAIRAAISPRTKAIMVVHYGGNACDMDAIMQVAEGAGVLLVEDAAQAFLSTYKGRYLGTIGHLGCISFHYTKNTICGEGGALLVNDSRLQSMAVVVREKGTNRTDFMMGKVCKYEWLCLGSSYVPSELCAAFLQAQLAEAPEVTKRRRRVCSAYRTLLAPLVAAGHFYIPQQSHGESNSAAAAGGGIESCGNGHLFAILFPSAEKRQATQSALADRNVQCLTHFVPLHLSKGGLKYGRTSGSLERTMMAAQRLLRLPVWPGMHSGHIYRVVSALYDHFGLSDPPSIASVVGMFRASNS